MGFMALSRWLDHQKPKHLARRCTLSKYSLHEAEVDTQAMQDNFFASELERNVASAEPSSHSNDQAHRSSESSPVQDFDDGDSFLDDGAGNSPAGSDEETS